MATVKMPTMARSPAQAPSGPPRPLCPRDLFGGRADGDAVTVSMRTSVVEMKTTRAGHPWAVVEGQWPGHRLRCIVFPKTWAQIQQPSPGDAVVVNGKLSFREGQPVAWVMAFSRVCRPGTDWSPSGRGDSTGRVLFPWGSSTRPHLSIPVSGGRSR